METHDYFVSLAGDRNREQMDRILASQLAATRRRRGSRALSITFFRVQISIRIL